MPLKRSFSIINLLHTKISNQIKADYIDKLHLIYINSPIFKQVDRKYLEPNRILFNLMPDQEIEPEDEYLPPPLTSSNILGKWLRDSEDKEEENYSLGSAQPTSACWYNFLDDVL